MSNETHFYFSNKKDEEQDLNLENLIEKYLKKSQELEKRESKVFQQIELLQSAVASLHAWTENRKSSLNFSSSVPVSLNEIEEEPQMIKEETRRIQQEIRQKIEENKKLEQEIQRRKILESEKEVKSAIQKMLTERGRIQKMEKEEIESRKNPKKDFDLEVPLFKEKLLRLEEMEKNLKKELMLESEEFKKKRKSLNNKIALLELESMFHRQFIENLKKQNRQKSDIGH